MFTGIVKGLGQVLEVIEQADGLRRLTVECPFEPDSIDIGASIACSGVCLTVVDKDRTHRRRHFGVDAAAETLRLTTAGRWRAGTPLNLERALRVGDELGGHLVSGHVDGIAEIARREDLPDMARLHIGVPRELARFIAPKGSVALDGVSLTVNAVKADTFSVLIIPHTLAVTTLGGLLAGAKLNVEVDMMARYAARLLDAVPRR